MGWDGTNVPVSPRCLGGRGGGCSPREAPRLAFCAQLPAPIWGRVSGLLSPAFASLWFLGWLRALKDSPSPSSRRPRGLGPKCSIPNACISNFPARTPLGTLGEALGAAPTSTPASELDILWATPVPEDSPDRPASAPRTPSPLTCHRAQPVHLDVLQQAVP